MKSSVFKYIFIIFVIVLIILTCVKFLNSDEEIEKESLDQTSKSSIIQTNLRLAIADFDTLNPIVSNNKNVQEISKIIYEPLVTLDANLKLQYCLAKEIAKKDDFNYILKLKEGIKFQDGTELLASDVKFTMDIIKSGINSIYTSNLNEIENYDVIDNYTISITLKNRVPFFEYYLTFPIMSQKYFENEDFINSDKLNNAIGTGMFYVDSIEDNVIKLVKNKKYWNSEKNPMIEEIDITLYNTIGNVYDAFKNGDIDILNVSTIDIDKYIGILGHVKLEYKTRYYDFFSFNTQNKIFSDSQVRKAISLCIDKNSMVATTIGQGYTPSNFSLDMGSWLFSDVLNVECDLEQAKQILINAGWEYKNNSWSKIIDGKLQKLEFSITVNSNNELRKLVAKNILSQLANFGIYVTIKEVSPENYVSILEKGNYETLIAGLECGFSPNLETFFGENNLSNYVNEEMRNLLVEVSNTNDDNILKDKYNRIYQIYIDEAPYFGLFRETDYIVYNQSLVGNLKTNVFNIFQNIEKWYRQ